MTDTATKTPAQIAHEQRNAERKAQAAQAKVDRFLAHVERNNVAAEDAASRRADSDRQIDDPIAQRRAFDREFAIAKHQWRNFIASEDAAVRRAQRIEAHRARNEAAALATATRAFAEAVEAAYGIAANDDAAIAKAA